MIKLDDTNFKKRDVGVYDEIKFKIVDTTNVRLKDIRFTMGGHHYVYPAMIQEDEIFLDNCIDKDNVIATSIHEFVERLFMKFCPECHKTVSSNIGDCWKEIFQLRAKLRELVKAAEWRDELVCFYTTPRTDKIRNKNGWWDRFDYENCRKADAEAAYQAALKTAKEGDEMSKIVMYDSEEAATYQHNIEGWVDRHGIFCGKDEDLARWRGCTHRPCSKCGKPAPKSYTVCDKCRRKADAEKFEARERKDWNEKGPVYSDALDCFFDSWDEINDAADEYEMEVKDLRLLICEPVFAREIEPEDYYHDLLPDDGTLPAEIEEAFKALNAAIRDCKTPLSWEPGKFAVKLQAERR